MAMTKSTTAKSVIFNFDGYSDYYRAYEQGAFVGKFIVPAKFAHLIRSGAELTDLLDMRHDCRYGIILRNAGKIQ